MEEEWTHLFMVTGVSFLTEKDIHANALWLMIVLDAQATGVAEWQ